MALSSDQREKRKDPWNKNKGKFGKTITTSDSVDLSEKDAELFIGTGGNLKVDLVGGNTVTLKNIASGTFLKGIFVNRVYRTGTTARDIIAIY
jgi:hypothetical protein